MGIGVPVEWLLDGEPYVAVRVQQDLLGSDDGVEPTGSLRAAMLSEAPVRDLVDGLHDWPGVVIASHKSAGQPFHRLTFLSDLGLTVGDPGVREIADAVMAHQSAEGPFQLPMTASRGMGGSGHEAWAWALCDAPLSVYALAGFGLAEEPNVRAAADHLVALVRSNGWPCVVSEELGSFRGPGKKADPCPFATLAVLKALSRFDDLAHGEAARTGTAALLDLWEHSRDLHPYMFFMGTDFRKLKAPFVWYDLLHVLDVLSRFDWAVDDRRFRDMLSVLIEKADDDGRFTAESVWTAWRGWEFCQKNTPSRWITALAWRILGRAGVVEIP